MPCNRDFFPYVPTLKRGICKYYYKEIFIYIKSMISTDTKWLGNTVFFMISKSKIISIWLRSDRRMSSYLSVLTYIFAFSMLFLWSLFLMLSMLLVSFSEQVSGFFPNDIPTHFLGLLAASQWLTPGSQMVPMAHYIFPGLMKKIVRNLTALAWCRMAEKAAQEEWLEMILMKMIQSLFSFKCCFYSSSSLRIHILNFLPWKYIINQLDTTVS